MPPINTAQARVIDPVLTAVAQGYIHVDRVGHMLFPRVEVVARGGKVIEFGKEGFRDYNSKRAPGADTQMIQFGYEGNAFALEQYALNTPLAREHIQDAQKVPGVDLGTRAINTLMNSLTLTLEIQQAELATNADNYKPANKEILAGQDQWSNPDSDPIKAIDDAKDQLRGTCGIEPNTMAVGKSGFKALKAHPKIIERFKYTTAESITTAMLASLFDLEKFGVGKATKFEGDDDTGSFQEVWGNKAVLAYVPTSDMSVEQPSFGYTYALQGNPYVEKPHWDNSKKSWVYGVTYERVPVLTGIASGFLFQDVSGE